MVFAWGLMGLMGQKCIEDQAMLNAIRLGAGSKGCYKEIYEGPFFLRDSQRYDTWRKKTAGAVFLRRVMSKFNAVSVFEFIECLAALSSVHSEDMDHKVTGSNQRVAHVLWPKGAGSAAVRALHSEVKNWFSETQQIHQSTLRMKLLILTLGKQIPHFHAMANPTISQCSSRILMARAITSSPGTELTWQTWCAELSSECRVETASLRYNESRAEEVSKVREFTKKRPARSLHVLWETSIENIHAVRDAWRAMGAAVRNIVEGQVGSWFKDVANSGWYDYIGLILGSTLKVVEEILYNQANVVIHCSDGWDRTAQVSSLVMLCLDPYYRTQEKGSHENDNSERSDMNRR
ncbi:Myotubularin-related protein 2 [Symbiodinium microadriaticum]|uniref:Myotubularin-related protein 2 n=1 Tax=Symbiodinium microadriaticum TaxID=2951 RepID=A0A1Q9D692_SYMMI|nr:Myotubularin-related protein 2 [Symbiodinium microadriaticum]